MRLLVCLYSFLAISPTLSFTALPETSVMDSRRAKYVNFVYYTNWAIYARNYQPQQLPSHILTHVLYSFANVRNDGSVVLTDSWSDIQKHYPTDSWNDVGNNAYGCVKQLYLLKKQNRNLKTLLSIGGWTYGPNFPAPMATAAGRAQFAKTAVTLVKDLGLDGIDIDWEYPANTAEAANFVLLLQIVRAELDLYNASYGGNRQIITAAMPAGPQHYGLLPLHDMNQYLDYFNLMAYDYMGSFSKHSGHQANLYPSESNPKATEFSTNKAVSDYIAAGVPAHKIVLGMPLYGRAFQKTGGLGQAFNGIGPGTWEAGVYDFKDLPQSGAIEHYDSEAGASWSWDAKEKIIISYDNLDSIEKKTDYIISKGLGGGMFWEASGDRTGNQSLIHAAYMAFRKAGGLAHNQNTISFPGSQYDNVRAGMPNN